MNDDDFGDVCVLPPMEEVDDDLWDAMDDDEEVTIRRSVHQLIPDRIRISERNLFVGQQIGLITQALDRKGKKPGRPLEVGGFYLGDLSEGDNAVLRDFIIPMGLPVTEGTVTIAEHYPAAGIEIRERNKQEGTDYRMMAMFHIHPTTKGGLHHSHMDDNSLRSLVNKMSKTSRRVYSEPFAAFSTTATAEYGEDAKVLRGDALIDAIVKFVYPDDASFFQVLQEFGLEPDVREFRKAEFLARLLDRIDYQTEEPRLVHTAVSFVYNNSGSDMPFVKIGIGEKYVLSGEENYTTVSDFPIEVVERGINIPTLEEIAQAVVERVRVPARKKRKPVTRVVRDFWSVGGSKFGSGDSKGPSGTHSRGLYQPTREDIKKADDEQYTPKEVADLFAFGLFSYAAERRHAACRYSGYANQLIDRLSRYNRNPGVKDTLSGAVIEAGEIFEDEEEFSAKPIQHYGIKPMSEKIIDTIVLDHRLTNEFIMSFISTADTGKRSDLLRDYVQTMHAIYGSDSPATPVPTESVTQPIYDIGKPGGGGGVMPQPGDDVLADELFGDE